MIAFGNHFSFEFRSGIRSKQMLLMNYLFPIGFYLMMGFIMPAINPPFRQNLIPALIVFSILSATLLGLPDPLVNARETGIFRNFKINGVPAGSILAIPALTTILHLVIVAAIITVTAPLLFGAPLPQNWGAYILIFLAMAFACAGYGVLIGVISPNSRTSVLWSQVIFVPSILLGGLMIPNNLLPEVAGKLAQLLPATQAMNAFNGLAMASVAEFSPWGSVAILVISGIFAFGLSAYLFSWDSRNTTRRGNPILALMVLLPSIIGIFIF